MKKIPHIIILLFCLFIGSIAVANNEPIVVKKIIGTEKETAVMYLAVDGAVKLFYEPIDVIEYERTREDGFTTIASKEIDLFYIGTGKEVEQINSGNYKRLVKKYLSQATELHKRIGKRGFRFENLPSMILYYNRHLSGKRTPLTKKEIARILAS